MLMSSLQEYTLCFKWIPIYDKQHYPLKGIHPVFFQNILELLFLVGFVWYLKWSPLLVLCYVVVEVGVVWFFSVLKSRMSLGWLQHQQVWLFIATGLLVGFLSSACLFLGWEIDSSLVSTVFLIQFIWNDNEFLLCLLAIFLQQVLEFYKHKKMLLHFPADRIHTFLNPVLRLLVQQGFYYYFSFFLCF